MRKLALAGAMMLAGAASAGAAQMTVTSPDIKPGARIADEQVANGFGCSGGNISPALNWSGAPDGHEELRASPSTIPTRRPAAASGTGWCSIFPADVTACPRAPATRRRAAPKGAIQGRTDFGTKAMAARARPKATSRITINSQVFAVDADKLDADENASAAVVGFNLHFHTLAKATLIGIWGR